MGVAATEAAVAAVLIKAAAGIVEITWANAVCQTGEEAEHLPAHIGARQCGALTVWGAMSTHLRNTDLNIEMTGFHLSEND